MSPKCGRGSGQAYDFGGIAFTEWPAKADHFTAWRDYKTNEKSIIGFVTKTELGGCCQFETHKKSKLITSEMIGIAQFMRWLSRGKQL